MFERSFCQSDVVLGFAVCSHLCVVNYTGGQAFVVKRALVFVTAIALYLVICVGVIVGISYFLVVFVDDRFHVVHKAVANFDVIQVTTNSETKNYIGLTEGTFKQRFSQHKATFKHRKYTNSTELSKYIWKLRDNNQDFNIKWTIISRARPYNNISKLCDLCLTEKLMIITANPGRQNPK